MDSKSIGFYEEPPGSFEKSSQHRRDVAMKVYKVGGSCLASTDDLNIVLELAKDKPIFVFSALKGVTDKLIEQGKKAEAGEYSLEELRKLHYDTIESKLGNGRQQTKAKIDSLFSELQVTLDKIKLERKMTLELLDSVQAFGERLVVPIMEGFLNDKGIPAKALSDREGGFITTAEFGDANVPDEQLPAIKEKVMAVVEEGKIPVVAGFVGRTRAGKITTLGRGGSDLTATLIAAALGCEVVLFKDVDGLMSADPKLVPTAKIVRKMNSYDALEVAHYGSKVVFEKAIFPLLARDAPLNIRSFRGKSAGTIIDSSVSDELVVSTVKEASVLEFTGTMAHYGALMTKFAEIKYYPLAMLEISYGESSIIVDTPKTERLLQLLAEFKFTVKSGYSMVALIGASMKGKSGIAVRIFRLLADKGINVDGIFASPSGRNISVLIEKQNLEVAANVIHAEFIGK
ncbi:hypothetical protein COT30_03995 [Candidatus Micrarchaeota archaeon CG08_land_8_20_14_0_20_49_17]|nr:MAG: hypothetical protein AUJ13_03405 [Candidatus Micrarchaeota archaeon CG1_02_49_24]PIU09503.1 MAG: hypothetical protein COT30_03995 [Candidatus Micrarchaeota archaeon CG08_land_8_20_14_0_20_49_17]PIU82503.1 MAG: hypothetical protein COS70_00960 [Candidatus Micrarchaeota archaeon CG06_land_8_20_14_3_00_50_6]PIZ94068.1 MAG: hypothetical protein COX84_05555 [Candidatus Micrarchaeota archaeon CG_4_10_14_0_2_um_filter_49_7]HII54126.1 aspartate kinase [Candidatus Micrarchaeota archaeon]